MVVGAGPKPALGTGDRTSQAVSEQIGYASLGALHLLDAHHSVPGSSHSGSSSRHGVPPHPPTHWVLHPQTHLCAADAGLECLPGGECRSTQPQQ